MSKKTISRYCPFKVSVEKVSLLQMSMASFKLKVSNLLSNFFCRSMTMSESFLSDDKLQGHFNSGKDYQQKIHKADRERLTLI